ncbi:ketoacyl-synt-domain-containing protein [Hypoxylon sp. FL1284]|nr:ketoacyl-synt-domain-containing protein [Hypoxylon sp. FL1284]
MAPNTEPIAIVGSSCRLPGGANSPSKLWELLKNPKDVGSAIPENRFSAKGFYHPDGDHHGTMNVEKSYFLDDDPTSFDNSFFNISAKEAEAIDAQQRFLLEVVYEGIESAGYSLQALQGSSTSVFIGQMNNDYYETLLRDVDSVPQYTATGISRAVTANRVSYFFDWTGPSMTIDTACSSSLVAIHEAVQTIRSGKSTLAVAGGVNLILGPEYYIFASKLHMLSPTGKSRMWDTNADGYARGEGVAAVVLKPLSQAIADGDNIECIVRDTGVNSDGRTVGMSVPSSTAQTALIESTYKAAGLDCHNPADRCQYFEAHGTGTQAGDPKEAEAISKAFFPAKKDVAGADADDVLYVGSIKTVIGHTEGTAGVAGVLKASLALQEGVIPPNMHFNELNPSVKPFYGNLNVPTALRPWPKVAAGSPRRASVNSFGVGGTNAHVILESYEPESKPVATQPVASELYGPIILSAHSTAALTRSVSSLSQTLKAAGGAINLADLCWTLQSRRSEFEQKIAFSATSKDQLIEKLDRTKEIAQNKPLEITPSTPLRILGVFTGQGAQWPSMGAGLYKRVALFKESIDKQEAVLSATPDGPTWSLTEQLLATGEKSRVHVSEVSQLLCTALQVALVDLLKASGVQFSGVVGHSSGEIAAAYAAGYISAADAVLIAFYRGRSSSQIATPNGKPGKMLAGGLSQEEATSLCSRPQYTGRIRVAAVNSPTGVTISGDGDGIEELDAELREKGAFSRVLKVDKAYHSHHMVPCADDYLVHLRKVITGLKTRSAEDRNCTWYSSVHGKDIEQLGDLSGLKDTYWTDNMVSPVLFYQAITAAMTADPGLNMAIEVGPHPALKMPALENIKEATGSDLLYQGALKRGDDDYLAFSDMLGFIWTKTLSSSKPVLSFEGFRNACIGGAKGETPKVLKTLPLYPWVHKSIIKESRKSKLWRSRGAPHELLGTSSELGNSSAGREVRWDNVLKLDELEWIRGHQVQNQVIFPAAGYIAMAIDSVTSFLQEKQPKLLELQDINFHRAIVLEEGTAGVHVSFVVRLIQETAQQVTVEYTCYTSGVDATSPAPEETNFTGRAVAVIGESAATLPQRVASKLPLSDIDIERFYHSMRDTGLGYTNPFRLTSIRRRLNSSTVAGNWIGAPFQVHPASLDATFHGLFAAAAFPGDGRMQTPYLPASVRRLRVSLAGDKKPTDVEFTADCYLKEAPEDVIVGDIDITQGADQQIHVQVEDILCRSFGADGQRDNELFARTVWKSDKLPGFDTSELQYLSKEDAELYDACERTVYYYLRQLDRDFNKEDIPKLDWWMQCYMEWALKIVGGDHERLKPEWVNDSKELIMTWKEKYPKSVDMQAIHSIGENISAMIKNTTPLLQILKVDDMLNRLYKEGLAVVQANMQLAALVGQLTHRNPGMKFLEIGGGTGATTGFIFKQIKQNFQHYTFTDISAGFFADAMELFDEQKDKMTFKVLNIERSPAEQGYEEGSYDVIVACNVLHATASLSTTIKNCRKLLRPGGHLVVLEITAECLRVQFIFGGFSGWWLGREDGRMFAPTVSEDRWNSVLKDSGFKGIDYSLKDTKDKETYTMSTMIGQAVDDRVEFLREPLNHQEGLKLDNLVIVGGETAPVSEAAARVKSALAPFAKETVALNSLQQIEGANVNTASAFVIMSDLDEPVFKNVDQKKFSALQSLLKKTKHVLWVTQGRRSADPYANMIVGAGRSIMQENPDLRIKFVDVDSVAALDVLSTKIPEELLRLVYQSTTECDDLLWTKETELAIEEGTTLIPRVRPDAELNERFNSERRPIVKPASLASTAAKVVYGNGSMKLEQNTDVRALLGNGDGTTQVKVHASSVSAFSFAGAEPTYVFVGTPRDSASRVLGTSTVNSSLVNAPLSQLVTLQSTGESDDVLSGALSKILSESALTGLTGTLWVHDAEPAFAEALRKTSSERGVKVFFSRSSQEGDSKATFVHPYSSTRDLRTLAPTSVKRFINLGVSSTAGIEEFLQNRAEVLYWNGVAKDVISLSLPYEKTKIGSVVGQAPSATKQASIKASAIGQGYPVPQGAFQVIDWTEAEPVSIKVRPLEATGMFSPDKTYFFAGMTGQVGLSICEWMIDHGARYFALTSRNPKLDAAVVKHLESKGGLIKTYTLDVADKNALQSVYQDIQQNMPPIGGVANAAMVLRDMRFDEMAVADYTDVLKPKVDGSKNLDELFYSTDLEFFIFFSSVTTIVGTTSQSNYATANMFMSSLAAQRRRRGVPASIIDIGMLTGIGYIAQMEENRMLAVEAQLRHYGLGTINEAHWHKVWAEAIITGRPGSGLDPELITGLVPGLEAPWAHVPMLSHYVYDPNALGRKEEKSSMQSSLESQLQEASDEEGRVAVLEKGFLDKLAVLLQVHAEEIQASSPLTKQGVDSLVAVGIRTWLLRELDFDLPVFKILGGASITEICTGIVGQLSEA